MYLLLPDAVRGWLDRLYAAALGGIPDGDAKTEGVAAGAAAAAAMLAARTDDGRFAAFSWQEGDEAGEWRPTPPGFANDLAWVGQVEPFTLESTSQLRTKGPNAVTSGAYAKEYNEVKDLGAAGSTRTPSRTLSSSSTRRTRSSCSTEHSGWYPKPKGSRSPRKPASSPC